MTTKGFQPGDSIVPMSSPFVKTLNRSQKGRLCDACFKPGTLRRCVGCKLMHYCGKKCQKMDWKDGHSVECKSEVFKSLPKSQAIPGAKVDPDVIPKLLRTLAKFHLDPDSFTVKHPVYGTIGRSFNDMIAHEESLIYDSISDAITPTYLFLALFVRQLKNEDEFFCRVDFDEQFLIRIFGVWKTNGFDIVNEEETFQIGAGLYIPHSAVNHGCRPNAIRVTKVDLMEIRCIHPIPVGEEPLISYLAGNRNCEERKAVLLSRYNFSCACDLCKAEASGPLIDYAELQSLKNQLACFNGSSYKAATVIRDRALEHFRKLYHEYDERTTNFCRMYFDIVLQWQEVFHNIPIKYLQDAAKDVETRLMITFGETSLNYLKFQQNAKRAGLELDATGKK